MKTTSISVKRYLWKLRWKLRALTLPRYSLIILRVKISFHTEMENLNVEVYNFHTNGLVLHSAS